MTAWGKIGRRRMLGILGGTWAGLVTGDLALGAPATRQLSMPSVADAATPPLTSTGAKSVSLTFWTDSDPAARHVERMAKTYTERNPGVALTISASTFPVGVIAQKMFATFTVGSGAPDLIAIHFNDFSRYLKSGWGDKGLLDLPPLLTIQERKDILWPEYWSWKGKLYGIPFNNSVGVFHYYKPAFDDVGVDPQAFKTWDDFVKAGLALKQKGKFITVADISGWNQWIMLASQIGGGFFDKDGNVILDNDGSVRALELFADLVNKDRIAWGTSQFYAQGVLNEFADTTTVGVIIPEWYSQTIAPGLPQQAGKWRMAPLPRWQAGGARTAHRGGDCVSITTQSKNQDVAWKFLHWLLLTRDGAVEHFLDLVQAPKDRALYSPTYLPAARDNRVTGYRDPFYGNQAIGGVVAELVQEAPPLYSGPYLGEAMDIVNRDVFDKVMKGEATPKQALKTAADEVRGLM